jgi:putative redox protein
VDITNAAKIYQAARHPKSFISLDGADHLLSSSKDSIYVGHTIAQWASRYVDLEPPAELATERQVVVRTQEGYTTDILAGGHPLIADEPKSLGGADLGPTPYGLLLASLGACTSITLRMYANRKQWPLDEVKIHLQHEKKHLQDSEDYQSGKGKLDHITKEIELIGDLTDEQRARLLEIADRCPVHRTLHSQILVESKLLPS